MLVTFLYRLKSGRYARFEKGKGLVGYKAGDLLRLTSREAGRLRDLVEKVEEEPAPVVQPARSLRAAVPPPSPLSTTPIAPPSSTTRRSFRDKHGAGD